LALKNILLDTNAYSAFKRGDSASIEILRRAETIGVSSVVLGELLSGFAAGVREADNRRELNAFLESPRVTVLPVNEGTADFYARVYHALKRKGKPIPANDLWIAATAFQHGFAVFTYDQHFREVEGLIVGCSMAEFLP